MPLLNPKESYRLLSHAEAHATRSLHCLAASLRHRSVSLLMFLANNLAKEGELSTFDLGRNDMPIYDANSAQKSRASSSAPPESHTAQNMLKSLLHAIVPIWKAQQRLQREADENRAARIVLRHIEEARRAIEEIGIEIRDYRGQAYDPGLHPVAPVVFEEREDCDVETVVETLTPAIFLHGRLLKRSKATIGVPLNKGGETAAVMPPSDSPSEIGVPAVSPPQSEAPTGSTPQTTEEEFRKEESSVPGSVGDQDSEGAARPDDKKERKPRRASTAKSKRPETRTKSSGKSKKSKESKKKTAARRREANTDNES